MPLTIRPAMLEGHGRPDVLVLPRGSSERLHVALFIAAGSRDASPPQAATIAAWLARQNMERQAQSIVYPDATEFSVDCPKPELDDCVRQLAKAIRVPATDPAHIDSLRARLVEARRNAEADPWRGADRLALRALMNGDASKTIPLGDPATDSEVTVQSISRVFDTLYPASPMLLVVVGDVSPKRVEESSQAAFTIPTDGLAHRREPPLLTVQSGVAVELDAHPRLTLALAAEDLAHVQGAAEGMRNVLEHAGVADQWEGNTWLVRGAAVALLRMRARDPFAAIEVAARQLRLWRSEGTPSAAEGVAEQDAAARARRAALRWVVGAGAQLPAHADGTPVANGRNLELGIGLLAASGRVDRVRDADPDAAARAAIQNRAQTAFKAGLSPEVLGHSGDADAHSASLRLENGAHVTLRREADEQVAIAIRYSCGARCDPPELHGRAALLATVTATACAELSAEQLRARLSELGAELRPYVDADSWGVTLQAPGARWQDALGFAVECALHPRLGRAELSEARLALRRRMGARGAGPDSQARVAEAVMPTAPGVLAPLGSTLRQNSVSLNLLREFWAVYRTGASVSVAAVGPISVEDALDRVSSRLSHLHAGPPWQAARVAPEKLRSAAQEGAAPESGIVLWRLANAPKGGGPGAEGFAALMRARLMEVPGWVPIWHGGGRDREIGAWAAVAVHTPAGPQPERLLQLKATSAKLAPGHLSFAASEAVRIAQHRMSSLEGASEHEASRLAGAPFDHEDAEVSLDASQRVAGGLAAASPAWLPLP